MERAIFDFPLALFSTLAPIGAGGFIALALAFFTVDFTDEQLRKIDRFSFIPFVVVLLGFLFSLFHLTSIIKIPNVFLSVGTSPLSNEIAVGAIFSAITLVYCLLAFMGRLSKNLRKGFSVVAAVASIIFSLFIGLAYRMDTIASWVTPLIPLEILGFCLLGGALLGTFILALTDTLETAKKTGFRTAILVVTVAGALLAMGAFFAHMGLVGSLGNSVVEGEALVTEVVFYAIAFAVGVIVALGIEWYSLFKKGSVLLMGTGLFIVFVAILIARLVFYALRISVGI